jgi:glycosyltransferase involved in cell wall biosynthesis
MHSLQERPVVVRNCPPRWRAECEVPRTDTLRAKLGIPEHQRVVLYAGAFLTGRGIEELLAVMTQDEFASTAAVFLGHGPLGPVIERARASPPLRDRLYLAGPAKPAELLEWVASADVSVAYTQPTCESYRLSSPNKLFESLAAGTPVVGSNLPEFERVIGTDGSVGALVDPASPESLGRAIRRILDLPPEQYEGMRRRARRLALQTYNWEIESQKLLQLYDDLGERPPVVSA